jgi:replicative DNA helicase
MNTNPTAIDLECLSYERIILGTCLLCPDLYPDAAPKVAAKDFVDPDHSLVWQMLADYFAALPVDQRDDTELWIGIQPKIDSQSAKVAERINGLLATCVARFGSPVKHNLWHACESVATYAAQARYRQAVARLTAELDAESNLDARAIIANAIRDLPQPAGAATEATTADHTDDVFASVLDGKATSLWVCPTGLRAFDERNGGGLHPGRLYVLAGRPGWGKTALALQWVAAACRQGIPCAFVSLEMPETDLILRLAAYVSGVFVMDRDYARWPLSHDERVALEDAQTEIRGWPLHLRCKTTTAQQLVGWASDLQQRMGVRVVAVDYIQILAGQPKQAAFERIGEASRLCKQLALQGLAVIAAAQLNREAESTERPTAATLSGADQIAMDADCVVVPWRPKDGSGAPEGYAELVTVKGRRTKLGRARVQWVGKTQSFADSVDDYLMQVSDGSSTARGGKW